MSYWSIVLLFSLYSGDIHKNSGLHSEHCKGKVNIIWLITDTFTFFVWKEKKITQIGYHICLNLIWKENVLSPKVVPNSFEFLRTVACQAPLSMKFLPRQECWSGLPFPSPGIFQTQGSTCVSLVSPALQMDSLPTKSSGMPHGKRNAYSKLVKESLS